MIDEIDNEIGRIVKGIDNSDNILASKDLKGATKTADNLTYTDLLPRGYLSVSQMTQFLKCGKAYERRYVQEITIPSNNFTVQGRGVHKAAEHLHLSLMENPEKPIDEEQMLDIYSDSQVTESEGAVLIDDPDWDFVKDEGVALTKVYRKGALGQLVDPATGHLHRPVQPIAAERVLRTMLEPPEGDPIPFMGVVDLEEPHGISDVKTKRKAASQADADNSLQLTLYAHVLGKPEVRFDQLVKKTKTKPERYIRTLSLRKSADAEHAIDIASDVAANIAAGNFPRTNPENWWCSAKWCPYWSTCRGKNL